MTVLIGLGSVTAFIGTASADNFDVALTPYRVNHILAASAIWNTYELSARNGDRITYSMTVTTPGACATLLFVQGHDVGPKSEFYISYSHEECAGTYSNSFPVEASDGKDFSILIETYYPGDMSYFLAIDILRPPVPAWILGTGVVVLLGLAPLVMMVSWRHMKGPAIPPLSPMPRPPPTTPPPSPPRTPPT